MASKLFTTTLHGFVYNIKHITRTCAGFGGFLLPDYPALFTGLFASTYCIIMAAWGTARARHPLPSEDHASDDEAGSDNNDGDDGTDPGYLGDNDDDEPDFVDFDLLDEAGQKEFIRTRWASTTGMSPGDALFFGVDPYDYGHARRDNNVARPGGFDGASDNPGDNDGVKRVINLNTTQESEVTPKLRDGDDEVMPASVSQVQEGNITGPGDFDGACHTPADNNIIECVTDPKTAQVVNVNAGLNNRGGDFGRTSLSESGRLPTTSSVPSTTSTDFDNDGAYKENELEELLGSVEKEANKPRTLRLNQDGMRSRYSIRLPTPAEHSSPRLEPREEFSLRPKPLKVRNTTQSSEDATEEKMSALDFFKFDEEDTRREDEERAAATKVQDKTTSSSPFASLKRIASSQFSKESKGTSKQGTEDKGFSPMIARIIARKNSSTKLADRDETMESTSSTQPFLSSPPGSVPRAATLKAGELESNAVPYDIAYTLTPSHEPSLTPPPKSVRRKPLLHVNTENAAYSAISPSLGSSTVTGGMSGLSSSVDNGFDQYFCEGGENQTGPSSVPIAQNSGKGKGKRSSSKDNAPGIFSPASTKAKFERFTNDSPEVKMIERFHLHENFGVSSTTQLLAQDDKKLSRRKGAFSGANATLANIVQAHDGSEAGSTDTLAFPTKARDVSMVGYNNSDSATLYSPQNSIMTTTSPARVRGDSRGSTVRTPSQRASGETMNSTTNVVSPVSSNAGGSMRIRRKEVGSGSSKGGSFTESVVIPGQEHLKGQGNFDIPVSSKNSSYNEAVVSPVQGNLEGTGHARILASPEHASSEAVVYPIQGTFEGTGNASAPVSSKASSFSEAFVSSGYGTQEGTGNAGTPITSNANSFSEVVINPVYRAPKGIDDAGAPRESIASSSGKLIASTIHGSGDEAGNGGTPSMRLKLEEEAAEKAADRKLAKEDHVIKELRKATGTEIVWYSKDDLRPPHPNHNCTFYSKNLICITCKGNCAICNAACCAFKGALQTAMKNKGTEEGKAAMELARSIPKWVSEGRDESSFLRCTECAKLVCPECISICPILPCVDQLCVKCHTTPWEPCSIHVDLENDIKISNMIKQKFGF